VAVSIEASGKKGGRGMDHSNINIDYYLFFLYISQRKRGIEYQAARPHPPDTRTEETAAQSAIGTIM